MTVLAVEEAPAVEGAAGRAGLLPQRGGGRHRRTGYQPGNPAGNISTAAGNTRDAARNGLTTGATYHRWVIAEFLVCVVLVAAHPFLKPGGSVGKGKDGTVTTLAAPLVRLTAISIIYFLLALLANSERAGKIAAAFGALVVLGVAFNSLPEMNVAGAMFGGKTTKAAAAAAEEAAAGDTAPNNAGSAPTETGA